MILPNKKYKIALIGYRLGIGGAEKVMANLSIFFEKQGIEIHNIIILDEVSYSYSGKLVNLGKLKNQSNGVLNKIKRLIYLKKYLDENNFDYIIDFRFRIKPIQELIIAKWLYKTKTIFTVHSYLINHYMPDWSFLTRFMYKNCYKIVSITNKSKELIEAKHHLKNVQTIYNPIDIDTIKLKCDEPINFNSEFIIGVGQMETNIKQFDKLIDAYENSDLPKNKIHLILLGDGKLRESLKEIAYQKNIPEKVHFFGFQENPFRYIAKAKFFVLSSLNEGLPNVILESLACQTPVVSFDCLSGPSEMIINHQNGILVENQNVSKLTEAMNLFINDTNLYDNCKKNSQKSIEKFSIENIGQQWLDLMGIN